MNTPRQFLNLLRVVQEAAKVFDIISALVTHLQTKPSDMLLLLATGPTDGLERRFCGLSHAVKTDIK